MTAQPVELQIFGRTLRINCPSDQQQALNQAACDLETRLQQLKERTRISNTEQLLFTVALNVCYELAEEQNRTRQYAGNIEQRIRALQESIERVLSNR